MNALFIVALALAPASEPASAPASAPANAHHGKHDHAGHDHAKHHAERAQHIIRQRDGQWPCHPGSMQSGPVSFSYESGSLGAPRRACPRTEVHIGAFAQAIAEPQNFYGNIQASVPVGGSIALSDRLEVYLSIEAFHYRNVIQSLAATHAGLGHSQLGATFVISDENRLVVSAITRTTLPTALGLYTNAYPIGIDAGFTAAWAPWDDLIFHGQLTGTGTAAVSAGDPLPRVGYASAIGLEYLPFSWLSLAATGSALMLYQTDLDHASIAGAARFKIVDGVSAELYVGVPFGGRERNLGQGGLNLRYRL